MADTSLTLNSGSGGANVAMKERTAASSVFAPVSLVGEAGSDNTAPVSATLGLAVDPKSLPPGAATSAKQDTGNTSLASLETKIGEVQASPTSNTVLDRLKALLTGIVLAAGSARIGKVTVRNSADAADIDPLSESDFDTKTGSLTEAAPATDTASSGLNGRLQRIAQRITSLIAALGTPLQAGGDVNVTDRAARDMGKIDIAAFDVALPSGSAKVGSINIRNNADSANIDPLSESDFDTKAGSLTETAPATDTASSGLNGRLQRIAQRISSLIALVPAALTGSGNFKAAIVESTASVTVAQATATNLKVDASGVAVPVTDNSGSLTVDQVATVSSISAKIATDAIMNDLTALTPKFAKIAASSSGNNNLVAAVTSKKIRVLAYNFIANGTVNGKFQSDGAGTPVDLTGLKYCVANMGLVAPFNPVGWFESASGKSLDINLSAAVAVGGELAYVEV